jgi:hypothetical protein
MKRLFRSFSSTKTKPRRDKPRRQGVLKWLPRLVGALILVLGIGTTVVFAQSDKGLKQQEDQLIRQIVPLPKAPTQAPVYRPAPAPAPRQEAPAPEPAPAPRREAPAPEPAPEPAPRQEAPEPAPAPRREAPAPEPEPAPPARSSEPAPEPKPSASSDDNEPPAEAQTKTANLPSGQYTLEFNRSPVVGNRFRLRGVYAESRLGFTRPRNWKVQSVKALIRFQHSPALIASRSNLTLRVNGTSIGSVPLNRKGSQVGQASFTIPANLIQDYNDLILVAQQNNDPKCSNPSDTTLWTEILPDSKLIFGYQAQAMPLNLSRYPYPFFDDLSLDTNRLAYLLPKTNEAWLTAAPRLQAALGRLADFRPIDTRIVKDLNAVKSNERLVIIGTPRDQPALKSLALPFNIANNQLLDGNKSPLAENVGVVMLATAQLGSVPVLVVTGNGAEGVVKGAQFLVQPDTTKIGTGAAIVVNDLKPILSPSPRQWPRYLPEKKAFSLQEIKKQANGKPIEDITVRGSGAPPIEIDFRALPDDQFVRGSYMTLNYSYGPQVNPRTSALEVLLDNNFIGGARLNSENGEMRQSLKVDLPANLVKPTSKLQVAFRLNPREPGICGDVTDQQLTGTLHSDTSFNLNRETSVELPNLELLQSGFPFAAPQDLSVTTLVVPKDPTDTDLLTLLTFSERLGRLSQAEGVKLTAYTADVLPESARKQNHLVGIGTREKFPFPEALESGGFKLSEAFSRQSNQANIQALADEQGVIKEVLNNENSDRVILALSAQTEKGLEKVQQVIKSDPWFFQLREDTVLVAANDQDAPSYQADAFKLEFLESAPSKRRIENTNPLAQVSRFLQENWFLLPLGMIAIALLLYGIAQLYLKRFSDKKRHN